MGRLYKGDAASWFGGGGGVRRLPRCGRGGLAQPLPQGAGARLMDVSSLQDGELQARAMLQGRLQLWRWGLWPGRANLRRAEEAQDSSWRAKRGDHDRRARKEAHRDMDDDVRRG